jgi:hypothetical protein
MRCAFLPVAGPNIDAALLTRGKPETSNPPDPPACAPFDVHHVPATGTATTISTNNAPKNKCKGVICSYIHIRRMHYVLLSKKFFCTQKNATLSRFQHKTGLAKESCRGRFIVPIADLSASWQGTAMTKILKT